MNKLFIGVLLMGVLLLLPSKAVAHVLMRDTEANIGAIVHINPDDDPVAGKKTQMFIDIQDSGAVARIPLEAYDVFITPTDAAREPVAAIVEGSVIRIEYTFRKKGVYTMEVVSKPSFETFQKVQMSYTLRVSRGVGASETINKNAWAEVVLPASIAILSLVVILLFSNRKEILAYSKF